VPGYAAKRPLAYRRCGASPHASGRGPARLGQVPEAVEAPGCSSGGGSGCCGPVVPHRGARAGMAGGDLGAADLRGRDECLAEHAGLCPGHLYAGRLSEVPRAAGAAGRPVRRSPLVSRIGRALSSRPAGRSRGRGAAVAPGRLWCPGRAEAVWLYCAGRWLPSPRSSGSAPTSLSPQEPPECQK